MIASFVAVFERLAWAGMVGVLAVAAFFAWQFRQWPGCLTPDNPDNAAVSLGVAHDFSDYIFDGSVFYKQSDSAPALADAGLLAGRFRLAGTFAAAKGPLQIRKAIIDDLNGKSQRLVTEGDMLDTNVRVVAIARDRVIVADSFREETLLLSFSRGADLSVVTNTLVGKVAGSMLPRFGNRVGEHRWVLKREALLDYYQELLEHTDRLAKVFESLKPIYQNAQIAGYCLDIEGEASMFAGFGLEQGDVIRKLNSMPMISQSRAEYFISEFLQNRVSGFVLDIERKGKPEKLIYLVR